MTRRNAWNMMFCAVISVIMVLSGCGGGGGSGKSATVIPPTTPTTPGEKPAGTKTTGFYVNNKKLYDANNNEFVIRGVNANHWWNNGTNVDMNSIPNIKAANANAVRCVFGKRAAQGATPDEFEEYYDNAICYTTELRQAAVEKYIQYHIVPIVEFHNATGSVDPAKVTEAVNFWISEKSWVQKYEKYVIINITNEWCNSGQLTVWRDTYISAVKALRDAGINNTIIIDSIQWGQQVMDASYYNAVFNADPQKNIIFSFHMYGGWLDPADTATQSWDDYNYYHVDTALKYLTENVDAPVIAGEFNHLCASTSCPDDTLLKNLESRNVGWIAWMWYNSSGNRENMVSSSASNVYTVFGKTVTSYLKNAKEATVFTTELPTLPEVPVLKPDPNWAPGGMKVTVFDISVTAPETEPNPWWLQIEMDNASSVTGEIEYIEMEVDGFTDRVRLSRWGAADPWNFSANMELKKYIGLPVRFWMYHINGSVAKTVKNTLVVNNVFAMDTSK